MEIHTITYEGVEFEIQGTYDEPEEETGYKGGFSWMKILINDQDVSWMLKENIINHLIDIINGTEI